MRIAIVDDEIEAIHTLSGFLTQAGAKTGISIKIDSFTDSTSFLSAFSPGTYHIVFLDIYIDNTDGLQLAQHIRKVSESTMIVFCTTSRENMPEAFHYHAFDYLTKPITAERVIQLFADALKVLPAMNRKLKFTSSKQEVSLPFSEFLWSQSSGHYLTIKSRSGEEYTARMTTKDFLSLLDGDRRFLLLNKGIIVNMDHIRHIEGGCAAMTDGTIFPVKVRQAAKIERIWQDYIFDTLREGQK